jgi:hypothetical protein
MSGCSRSEKGTQTSRAKEGASYMGDAQISDAGVCTHVVSCWSAVRLSALGGHPRKPITGN